MSWRFSRTRKLCYRFTNEKSSLAKLAYDANRDGRTIWEAAMPRTLVAICLFSLALPASTQAQGKGIRFWNLTTSTISNFQLSPAGKDNWSPNQTLNDKDKEVDHDERLRITGVEPGRYDAKVGYRDSRQCFVRDIEIKADAVFSIADKDLKDCNK
jgi:hypothetical protein